MRCFGCAFLVAAAAVSGSAEELRVGVWIIDNGGDQRVMLAYPVENPAGIYIGCALTDPPENRVLHLYQNREVYRSGNDDESLELVRKLWEWDARLDGSWEVGAMILVACLPEHAETAMVGARPAVAQRQPPEPVPYVTREEIEAAFEPMRQRFIATEALLAEMEREAMADWRESRGVDADGGYPLAPITIPQQSGLRE
ncbi:MAG: hypothetical protein OXH15_20040 [Gammaproteobacteria bacterium]|nr:hypothetical protein [Gammaproteobacteria bacterium]